MFDIGEFKGGGVTRRCFVIRLLQGSVLEDLIGSSGPRLHGRALRADHLPGLPESLGFAWGKEVFVIDLTVATDGVFYQIGQTQDSCRTKSKDALRLSTNSGCV